MLAFACYCCCQYSLVPCASASCYSGYANVVLLCRLRRKRDTLLRLLQICDDIDLDPKMRIELVTWLPRLDSRIVAMFEQTVSPIVFSLNLILHGWIRSLSSFVLLLMPAFCHHSLFQNRAVVKFMLLIIVAADEYRKLKRSKVSV